MDHAGKVVIKNQMIFNFKTYGMYLTWFLVDNKNYMQIILAYDPVSVLIQ